MHRRSWLATTGGVLLGSHLRLLDAHESTPVTRPKVAAIVTHFAYREHAHVILENFLVPYLFKGERTDPGCDVASLYVDQITPGDMSRSVAEQFGFPIYHSIAEALCLGGKDLAVDAVLSIGEHGKYPRNAKGQVEYPRKRFFDEIVAVFEKSGRGVPVFNDKHLSYRWDWAKAMYDTSRRQAIPFMAGSSVPLAERRPPLEIPRGAEIRAAVSIHGGPVESYDFHGLEVLQSLVEGRRGGERGVARVRFVDEPALWQAAEAGEWSPALADAAMAAELGPAAPPIKELIASRKLGDAPSHGILLDYLDGLKAIVLKVGSSGTRWNFACEAGGVRAPLATRFHVGPWDNRNLFKALSHAIQVFFRERTAPYPVERTLLTTGVLDAAMDSRLAGSKAVDTPNLVVAYEPIDYRALREDGSTWKIITDATQQPRGIEPTLGPGH
jgi:hypothetical protein